MITLDKVTLRLGGTMLLPRTSWQIRTGQNWAVLGPNGSGKSTLARAIRGDCPHVRGKLIRHEPDAGGSRIGYVSFELQEEILAREELREDERFFSGRGHELTASELLTGQDGDPDAIRRFSEMLDLSPLLSHSVRTLSNGETRKLLIARSLIQGPGILILDDPFAGLDAVCRPALVEAVTKLMNEGMQIILVVQRPEEVIPGISHVLLIRNGRVVKAGPRAEIMTTSLLRQFSGAVPFRSKKRRPTAPAEPLPSAVLQRTGNQQESSDNLVEMRNIHIAYGEYVVFEAFDWTVRRGENWAVVGPNGSGKTTLLNLITGDNLQVYANEVFLFGKRRGEGESIWEIRRRLGVVSPELQLRYRRPVSVKDVVLSGFFDSIGLYRQPDMEQEKIADRWLDILGMTNRAGRLFTQTSYGEKRLTLIARAMVKSPELLILDEPCQGLDGVNREKVLALMEEIGGRTGTSLIYITHHEEEMIPCISNILKLEKRRRQPTAADC